MTTIPFGAHEGRSVAETPSDYLLWLCCAWSVRRAHPALLAEAMDELHRRLDADKAAVLASLRPPDLPAPSANKKRAKLRAHFL